jgi:hypothetical protein
MIAVKRGGEVAVLPYKWSSPHAVLGIATVSYAGPAIIELTYGRLYHANDGKSIRYPQDGYIVPAKDEHRSALQAKGR